MKKIYLLFIAIFAFSFANAQITITNDNTPEVGDALPMIKIFEPENVLPGDAGENIIWDFSDKIEESLGGMTYNYIDPTGLPQVSIMNNPDMGEQLNSDPNNYFYFGIEANDGDWMRHGLWGINDGTEIYWAYTTPLKIYDYPFTYGNNHTIDDFTANGMMGAYPLELHATHYGYDCDAYGTLILPHRTHVNVVRLHVTETFTIAADIGLGGYTNILVITDNSYYWFTEGIEGPIMYLNTSEVEDLIGGSNPSTEYSAQWYHAVATEITTDFTVNTTSGDTYTNFNFTNGSNPIENSTFEWQFTPNTVEYINGTSSTSINPEVRFTDAGTYTVALTTTNSNFTPNEVTETKIDYIDVVAAPELIVDFSADNTIPGLSSPVNFTASINDETGTTYHWAVSPGVNGTHWGFTNFTTETDKDPQLMFYQAGCYSIQLIATNATYGNSPVTVTKMNYINAGGGCGDSYAVTFTVTDGTNPINGAEIAVTGQASVFTNSSGVATMNLIDATYNYTVTATGYDDFSGSFTVNGAALPVNISMAVGIETLETNNIRLFPNPTNSVFRIISEEPVFIQVYNISGKLLFVSETSNTNFEIDLSNNSKGLYFINIIKNNKVFTQKVILK